MRKLKTLRRVVASVCVLVLAVLLAVPAAFTRSSFGSNPTQETALAATYTYGSNTVYSDRCNITPSLYLGAPHYEYDATGAREYYTNTKGKKVYTLGEEETNRPIVGQTYRVGFRSKAVLYNVYPIDSKGQTAAQIAANRNYRKYYLKAEKYTKVTSVTWYLNKKKVSSKHTYKIPAKAYGKRLWVRFSYKASGLPAASTMVQTVGLSYSSGFTSKITSLPTVVKHLLWVQTPPGTIYGCYGLPTKPAYMVRQVLRSGNLKSVGKVKSRFQWYWSSFNTPVITYHRISKATGNAYTMPNPKKDADYREYYMQVSVSKSGYASQNTYVRVYGETPYIGVSAGSLDFSDASGTALQAWVSANAVKGAVVKVEFYLNGSLFATMTRTMSGNQLYPNNAFTTTQKVTTAQIPQSGASLPYYAKASLYYGGKTVLTATSQTVQVTNQIDA
jgi:hypothetical protein